MPHAQSEVVELIVEVIGANPLWRVVSATSSLVRTAPKGLEFIMPALGTGKGAPGSAWLTLDFWVEDPPGRLGVFWRANPVSNVLARNRVLKTLVDDIGRTGFEYRGSGRSWSEGKTPAFAGQTVSERWWPKGGSPSLVAARENVSRTLKLWTERLPAMIELVESAGSRNANSQSALPAPVPGQPRIEPKSPKKIAKPPNPPRPAKSAASVSATTPPIPKDIKTFRSPPHYTSIFEIYPKESRLYGTEDLYGDWNAEVLLMAKDAGSSKNFLPRNRGGLEWEWVHNPARPTNRNLIPLAEQLPGGKLYASFLGPLLRNDGQESGDLVIDVRIRHFVRRLFLWTVANMPKLRTVAVLGQDAWRELSNAVGNETESRQWKSRHLSGQPLDIQLDGRPIALFALNHPARIPAATLMQQPGWRRILQKHSTQ